MEKVIYTLPLDEFTEIIKKCVREEIKRSSPSEKENELLKIDDVMKLFGVSKVTIHKWRKSGILKYHRIASRVYFKRHEVLDALNSINKQRKT